MKKLISKQSNRKLQRTDLVYTERLNYCISKKSLGIHGTQGRVCINKAPKAGNDMTSCKILCCERGYLPIKRKTKVRCNCKFLWCCQVTCDMCEQVIDEYICK